MKKKNKINWFWAHRRNASLNQFSFLMCGLSGKGCYVFYDKDQLRAGAKYKDVQISIDGNRNFVKDFRRRTDEIFGAKIAAQVVQSGDWPEVDANKGVIKVINQ